MNPEDDRLADHINDDPKVYMDCTGPQILSALGASSVIGLAIGIAIGIVVGWVMLGLVIGMLLSMGLGYLALMTLQSLANKYYDSWINEKIYLIKLKIGLPVTPLVTGSRRFGRRSRR